MSNPNFKIINLFGVPSAGKSTVRAQLFGAMKAQFLNVDEIQEVAKIRKGMGMAWSLVEDQLGVFADQHTLQIVSRREGFQLAITDSPLLLSAYYAPDTYLPLNFKKLVIEAFNSFTNLNYFIENDFNSNLIPFYGEGRNHDVNWSRTHQVPLMEFLDSHNIPFKVIKMSDCAYLEIIKDLKINSII